MRGAGDGHPHSSQRAEQACHRHRAGPSPVAPAHPGRPQHHQGPQGQPRARGPQAPADRRGSSDGQGSGQRQPPGPPGARARGPHRHRNSPQHQILHCTDGVVKSMDHFAGLHQPFDRIRTDRDHHDRHDRPAPPPPSALEGGPRPPRVRTHDEGSLTNWRRGRRPRSPCRHRRARIRHRRPKPHRNAWCRRPL